MGNKAKRPVGRPSRKPDTELMQFMLEKYKASEVARILGVPSSTVRSWKHRDISKGEISNGNGKDI